MWEPQQAPKGKGEKGERKKEIHFTFFLVSLLPFVF
jgi:hypothetical protein